MKEDLKDTELVTHWSLADLESVHEKLLEAFQEENVAAVKACLKNHKNVDKLMTLYKNAISAKYPHSEILRLCLMRMLTLALRDDVLEILDKCKPETVTLIIATIDYDVRAKLDAVDPGKYRNICSAAKAFTREECVAFFALYGFASPRDNDMYGIRSNVGNMKFNAAAYRGDIKTLQQLLAEQKPGKNLVLQRLGGWTPLHCAAITGREETVRFLLAKGALPATENLKKKTALQCAKDPAVQAVLRAAEARVVPIAEVVGQTLLSPPQRTEHPSSVAPSEIQRKNSK